MHVSCESFGLAEKHSWKCHKVTSIASNEQGTKPIGEAPERSCSKSDFLLIAGVYRASTDWISFLAQSKDL